MSRRWEGRGRLNYVFPVVEIINWDISGFDGGLPANFLLELYDAGKMKLLSQMTNKVPIFEVSNIDPGDSIKLYLYAENEKGTSEPAIIDDSSQNPQKHYVEGERGEMYFIILCSSG